MVLLTGGAVLLGIVIVAFVMATSGPNTSAALKAPTDPTPQNLWDGRAIGPKTAPATLLAFEDFQCPACDAFSTQMEPQLIRDYVSAGKLRIVYNDFAFIGQELTDAAVAARCAGDQNLFWPYHDYLFANQQGENKGGFSRDRLLQIADAVGVPDKATFTACLDTQAPKDGVKAETTDGQARGIDFDADPVPQRPEDRRRAGLRGHREADRRDRRGRIAGGVRRSVAGRQPGRIERRPMTSRLTARVPARRIFGIHPGLILAVLDVIGLAIATYLSVVELSGNVPVCGPLHGCETVATSPYSRIAGVPVAVYGVGLSLLLLSFAIAWWKTDIYALLLVHYGLSLAGVLFEIYFLYLQIVVIKAVCVWCTSYGLSLIARFVIALIVWARQPKPDGRAPDGYELEPTD